MPPTSIFTSVINSYLPEPHASLLNGILFGTQLRAGKELYEQLKIVGLLHIVVLSGMNITILIVIIGYLTRFLGKLPSVLTTILMLIIFILFVGLQAPTIRAGVMGILTLVAIILGRKNFALYGLLIAAFITAIFWPKLMGSLSFQLSYAATLGIILFGQIQRRKSEHWYDKLSLFLWKDIKPSLAAQVFTLPIVFVQFKALSLIAPLSNLLVAFLIPPLMVFGLLTAVLGNINHSLGLVPAWITYVLLSYILLVINILAKFDFSYLRF